MDNRREDSNKDRDRNYNDQHLYRLSELDDYKVASDDPDVRGWPIVDRDNHQIGKVSELLVDTDKEKVRYLDIVKQNDRASDSERHLLIPVGVARLVDDDDDKRVVLSDMNKDFLDDSYPEHRGGAVTRDDEYMIVERFNKTETSARGKEQSGDFYENDLYDENRFYSNRNNNRNL